MQLIYKKCLNRLLGCSSRISKSIGLYKITYLGSLLKSSLGKIVITVIFVKDHQLAQILSTSFNRVVNWYLYDQMKIK